MNVVWEHLESSGPKLKMIGHIYLSFAKKKK